MFVSNNDSNVDHLIDITREPYYKKVNDINQNIFNICEIIYKKSLDYGFSTSKSLEFSRNAGLEHLENNPNANQILDKIMKKLSNDKNILSSSESIRCLNYSKEELSKEFSIVEETEEKIIIHDHCQTGIEILKHLVGIESKMIIYELSIIDSCISVSFLDNKGTEFKITDFNLSKKNVRFIKEKIKIKHEIITVIEVHNNIKVFFLGKMIYDTKEGKIVDDEYNMRNLSSEEESEDTSNKKSENDEIKPYEERVLENDSYEDTDEDTDETEDIIETNSNEELYEYNNKNLSIKSESTNKILINPILLLNLRKINLKK